MKSWWQNNSAVLPSCQDPLEFCVPCVSDQTGFEAVENRHSGVFTGSGNRSTVFSGVITLKITAALPMAFACVVDG